MYDVAHEEIIMVSCIWNGERIDAFDICKKENVETAIRKAGAQGQLSCIDPNCKSHIGYKHGPKKSPHFFHCHITSICEYDRFEKGDREGIKNLRNSLFELFKKRGYKIEREHRMPIGGKFCHLLIQLDEKFFVLQIADKSTSVNDRETLLKSCSDNGYELRWVVIGNPEECQQEEHNYHIHRNLFNNSKNNDLVIIDENSLTVSQTKWVDDARIRENEGYYRMTASFDQLTFEDGEVVIVGFYENFSQWFNSKLEEKEKRKSYEEERQINYFNEAEKWPFLNEVSTNISKSDFPPTVNCDSSDQEEEPSCQEIDYSKYKVGARVEHERYKFGTILSVDSETRKTRIKFDSGVEDNFSIDYLIKSSGFKFL